MALDRFIAPEPLEELIGQQQWIFPQRRIVLDRSLVWRPRQVTGIHVDAT